MPDFIAHVRSICGRVLALPKTFPLFLAFLVCVVPAVAEHTRFWRQSDYDAFQKGDAKGVALQSVITAFLETEGPDHH